MEVSPARTGLARLTPALIPDLAPGLGVPDGSILVMPLRSVGGCTGKPPQCPRPLAAQPGRVAGFPLPKRTALSVPGDLFPSPGSRPGYHQPRSTMENCPCSHSGHQPVGSCHAGTGLPHPRLPAAPRSEVSFTTVSFSCSLQPHAGAEPLPSTVSPSKAGLGPQGHPSALQPSRLPPKVCFLWLRQDPHLPASPHRDTASLGGLV